MLLCPLLLPYSFASYLLHSLRQWSIISFHSRACWAHFAHSVFDISAFFVITWTDLPAHNTQSPLSLPFTHFISLPTKEHKRVAFVRREAITLTCQWPLPTPFLFTNSFSQSLQQARNRAHITNYLVFRWKVVLHCTSHSLLGRTIYKRFTFPLCKGK